MKQTECWIWDSSQTLLIKNDLKNPDSSVFCNLPQEILDAAYEFMDEPEFVLTNTEELDVPPIKMHSISIGRANKLWALSRLLSNTTEEDQVIVFCNTKRMVDLSVQKLSKAGIQVKGLHGDLSQNQRERILDSFKRGDTKTIIARCGSKRNRC